MLLSLKVRSIRLMTNNPRKIKGLEELGITVVDRIPLIIPPNPYNRFYLETKSSKSGHLLGPDGKRRLAEQMDPPVVEGMFVEPSPEDR
jgi:GTP cyclohydrolase II